MPKLCLGFLQQDWHPADPTSADNFIYRYYLSELTIGGNGKFLTLGDAGSDPYFYTTTAPPPRGGPAIVNSLSSYLNKKPCFTFSAINDFSLLKVQFQHNASQAPVESSFRRPLDGDTFKAQLVCCYSSDADDPSEVLLKTWVFNMRLYPLLDLQIVGTSQDRQKLEPLSWTCTLARDKVYCLFPAHFRFPESQPAFWCHDPATGTGEELPVPEFLMGDPNPWKVCGHVFVAAHDEILISLSNTEFYSYSIKLGIWRKVAFRPEHNENCKPPLAKISYSVAGEAMCSYGDEFYVVKFDTLCRYTLKFGTDSMELICSGVFCLPPNCKLAHVFSSKTEWQSIHPFSDNLLCIIGVQFDPDDHEKALICFSTVFLLEDSFIMIPLDSAEEMVGSDISHMSCFIMDAEPRLYHSTLLHNIAKMKVQERQPLPVEASPGDMEQKMKSLLSEVPPIKIAGKRDPVGETNRFRLYATPWAVFYFDELRGNRTVTHHPENIREARLKRKSHCMSLFFLGCLLGSRYALYRIDVGQDGYMLGSNDSFLQPIYVIDMDEERRKRKTVIRFQSAVLDRRLYLVPFEYFREKSIASLDTFVLDTSQMELSLKSRMKTAKSHGSVMCASKKIYVLKDSMADEVPISCFESYDPRTDLWEELLSPPAIQKFRVEGYAVVDDRFIIITWAPLGYRELHSGDCYAYDTRTPSWSRVEKASSDKYYNRFNGKAECVDRNILVILGGCVVLFKLVGEHPNFQLRAPVVLADNFLPEVPDGIFRCWSTCMTHLGDLRFCVLLAINVYDSDTADSLHAVTFQAFLDAKMGHLMFDPNSVMVSKHLFSLQPDNALSLMHCFVE